MTRILLSYSNTHFADAFVDDDLEELTILGPFGIVFPKSFIRSTPRDRPDIYLAMLREDPVLRMACVPVIARFGTNIRLVHLVLRPRLRSLVLGHESVGGPKSTHMEINSIRSTIGRIAYENSNRLDCRRANLREIPIGAHNI